MRITQLTVSYIAIIANRKAIILRHHLDRYYIASDGSHEKYFVVYGSYSKRNLQDYAEFETYRQAVEFLYLNRDLLSWFERLKLAWRFWYF